MVRLQLTTTMSSSAAGCRDYLRKQPAKEQPGSQAVGVECIAVRRASTVHLLSKA